MDAVAEDDTALLVWWRDLVYEGLRNAVPLLLLLLVVVRCVMWAGLCFGAVGAADVDAAPAPANCIRVFTTSAVATGEQ